MLFRVFVVAYGVGVFLGLLGLIEWVGDRAGRVWLRHLQAAAISVVLASAVWLANRRKISR